MDIPISDLVKALGPLLAGYATVMILLVKLIDRLLPNPMEKALTKIALQTHDLHEAHLGDTARDAEGRLKWWVPQSLTETLSGLLQTQRETLEEIKQLNAKNDFSQAIADSQMIQAKALETIATAFSKKAAEG